MARRWVSILLFIFVAWAPELRAQDAYDEWKGLYHPYASRPEGRTRTPRGYKPFYISHIGRHGSRSPVNPGYVANGLDPLRRADSLGLLTPAGKRILRGFGQLDSASQGTYGLITELGASEQKGIALRMVDRYPRVFRQKGRDSIACYSTHKQRAILSMTNFGAALAAKAPRMHIGFMAGEKYYDIMCREELAAPGLKAGSRKADAAMKQQFDFKAFYSRIFTDPERARSCFKSDRLMAETCVTNGSVASYMGIQDIMLGMTPEEFKVASGIYNAKQFMQHCGSAEQGEWRMHIMDPLVLEFVSRADEALSGGRIAADLRFSHDVGLMPFFSLIGLEGYDKRLPFEEVNDWWNATYMMPMAANLQLVFYRGRKDDVIVKVLFNEGESSFPALGPGPFYPWTELRSYLLRCAAQVPDN